VKHSITVLAGLVAIALTAASALAGVKGAHFVGDPSIIESGATLSTSGKVAGLGAVEQIHVTVSADAACINPGNNHPQAGNKESFSASGDFPVQNGRAEFSLDLTAAFQPDCTPPMTVDWSNIVITVTAPGVLLTFP
jgi:hypothetical protein